MAEPAWMKRLERGLGALAATAHRRPFVALAAVALLTGAGAFGAQTLKLNADLIELLPRSFQSVQDLDKLAKRFGGIGYVVVVGQGSDPAELKRFAEEMAPKLEKLPGVRFVEYKRPSTFFQDRALYYLKLDDLKEIESRVKAREKWERRQRNPLLLKLDDEPAPSLDFSDIESRYSSSADRKLGGSGQEYYLDEKAGLIALLVKPAGMSGDLGFSKKMVDRVDRLMAEQDLSRYGGGVKYALTGAHKKKVDQQQQITRDLAVASSLALFLMLAYIWLHFRSLPGIGLVLIPVGVGLAWTYGFVAIAYGVVNLLTAFLGAILGGLGTEHGMHLLGRYSALRHEGRSSADAIREAQAHTGASAMVASLVAALTFLSLAISEFRAFREFGIIAAAGMFLVLAAYLVTLPALLGVLDRLHWKPAAADAVAGAHSQVARFIPRATRPILIVVGAGMLLLILRIGGASFDYNFASLQDSSLPSFELDREVNKLLGYSQTPSVILTNSEQDERALLRQIEERRQRLGSASTVDFAAALGDIVPEQQEEKAQILASLDRTLSRVDEESLPPNEAKRFEQFRTLVQAKPFGREDVPVTVRRQFEGVSEDPGGFVLVFPRVSTSDGKAVQAIARELRGLSLADGSPVAAAGENMILADIIDMVSSESTPVLFAAVGLVLLALLLTLGSVRTALLCLVPTVVSVLGLVGLMAIAGIRFNFLNMVAIPVLIGTTVDAGVHLVSRIAEAGEEHFTAVLAETGRAITGGLLTSAVGFGAMVLAAHPGLQSLGILTILGFSINLVLVLLGFPAALVLLRRRRAGGAGGPQLTQVPVEREGT